MTSRRTDKAIQVQAGVMRAMTQQLEEIHGGVKRTNFFTIMIIAIVIVQGIAIGHNDRQLRSLCVPVQDVADHAPIR